MPPKKQHAAQAHPAMIGYQYYLNKTPSEGRHASVMRELESKSGMSKLSMMEHIGHKALANRKPRVPSEEEQKQEKRMNILEK